MRILKDFDIAIAKAENTPSGYKTQKGIYDSYMCNDAWERYLSAMSAQHQAQYGDGSGGELKEKNGRPPKMASFASSSRMTYLLSRDIPGFVFEKQLSTVIGGIANLDGYCESDGRYIFVEAKCREPYSHKSPQVIKENYRKLYAYLQTMLPEIFSCTMETIHTTANMQVAFYCRGKEVVHFDIKQMLCHLLGVANKLLKENACEKSVLFLYLLYDPTDLALPEESREKILSIYRDTCAAAENYSFSCVFSCVVDYLIKEKKYAISREDVEKIKRNFQFVLCNQNSYPAYFKEAE